MTCRTVLAVSSRGSGDLESMRLNKFPELFRSMRTGLLTTLCVLASSGTGEPAMLEGLLPMSSGGGVCFGFLDGCCATCSVIVARVPV